MAQESTRTRTGKGRGRRTPALVYAIILSGAVLLPASVLLAPWLASRDSSLARALYGAFSNVCHQIPGRCPVLFGLPAAVCWRCLGVYLGFLAGCLIYPFTRSLRNTKLPGRMPILALSLPLAADVLGNALGLWNSGLLARLASGLAWGAVLPFYLLPAAVELGLRLRGLAIRGASQ
jgi:uncharacterized membrane protein